MAFGQSPGHPATARQMQQLTELIGRAGHTGFRDARGPLGLNQRQAGGRFTRDEADELIAQLEAAESAEVESPPETPSQAIDQRQAKHDRALAKVPDAVLAAELQRRGWVVMEP